MSEQLIKDVEKIHEKFKIGDASKIEDPIVHRLDFIDEEVEEIKSAVENQDPEGIVDGLVDLIVVAIGTLDLFQVRTQEAWDEVHNANMQKEKGNNPNRDNSNGQDLIKPDGWTPPSHEDNYGIILDLLERTKFNRTNSSKILESCIQLQNRKSQDYTSDDSGIVHADYYPKGVESIYQILHMKMLRAKSIIHKIKTNQSVEFEGLEDTFMDMINYCSFAVSWIHGDLEGQNDRVDIFNDPVLEFNIQATVEQALTNIKNTAKKFNKEGVIRFG